MYLKKCSVEFPTQSVSQSRCCVVKLRQLLIFSNLTSGTTTLSWKKQQQAGSEAELEIFLNRFRSKSAGEPSRTEPSRAEQVQDTLSRQDEHRSGRFPLCPSVLDFLAVVSLRRQQQVHFLHFQAGQDPRARKSVGSSLSSGELVFSEALQAGKHNKHQDNRVSEAPIKGVNIKHVGRLDHFSHFWLKFPSLQS